MWGTLEVRLRYSDEIYATLQQCVLAQPKTCAIIFANAGGPPGRGYAGLSQVTIPFVGALTRLGSCAEGMSVVDVDMQVLEDAEENYKIRADLESDNWHYDYRHKGREGQNSKPPGLEAFLKGKL